MLSLEALKVAVAAEGLVILLALVALVGLRVRIVSRRRQVERAVAVLEPALHTWLVLDRDLESVVSILRTFSAQAAFRSLAHFFTQHVPFERQQALAHVLRNEPWVAAVLQHDASRLWWRRFDAARMFSIVGGEDDVGRIGALLEDSNPAVRLVAIDAAARVNGRSLVNRELDELPRRQDAVQAYQFAALSRHPALVADALESRISPEAPVSSLIPWIDAAGALATPRTLVRVRALAGHPLPEVRLHVARALRRLADPDTPAVLLELLRDKDWRVRAQAARALGVLRCGVAVRALAAAARDSSWWVRYRSALALAQIGGPAREALLEVARGDDRMARDMSILVAGLSNAAVVEMSEV